MAGETVLIAEANAGAAGVHAARLERAGFACVIVDTAQAVLDELFQRGDRIKAVLLDLQLPDIDGLTLLQDNPQIAGKWPLVVATADASINRAIESMRLGASDFLIKPVAESRLVQAVRNAIEVRDTKPAQVPLARARTAESGYLGFVGTSKPMQALYRQIDNVARSRATVFITGESGTGKEVCAEAIHQASPRCAKPFIAINCGAIPENLLESELFGHLKGSFTGAVADRVGAVQAANGGTLFLDEICEMELKLQVKLLRFLQTGTIQRVGSARVEQMDVRIICATNRNPEAEVAAGRFREDLYYRLAVVLLALPPLRARGHDIALLANSFLERFGREEGKQFNQLPPDRAEALGLHSWPGNVRELQNLVRRAAVMFEGPDLPMEALPKVATFPESNANQQRGIVACFPAATSTSAPKLSELLSGLSLYEIERIAIDAAIEQAGGSVPCAARLLGVSPSTLYRRQDRTLDKPQAA